MFLYSLIGQIDLDLLLDSDVTRPEISVRTFFSSNCHNSVNFKARNVKFSMEVHLDILFLDLTSNFTSDFILTSTSEVKSLK